MVGHRATARYMQNWRQEVGAIVTVAPGTRRTIVSQRMADKLAASCRSAAACAAAGSTVNRNS